MTPQSEWKFLGFCSGKLKRAGATLLFICRYGNPEKFTPGDAYKKKES